VTSLEFRDRLARRTRRAKAPIALGMLEPLEAYFRLLTQWNAKINLTSLPLDIPTDETFDRLLVEPLAASKQIPTQASSVWFDFGSGGGSPAIPRKIARPAHRLTMIESKERKSAFLREAIRTLLLTDTVVTTERFEDVASRAEFAGRGDMVTVRAVKADSALFESAGRLLRNEGRLLWFRPAHAASPDPPGFQRLLTVQLIDVPQSFLSVYRRMFHVEHDAVTVSSSTQPF
jgi:16S rRNA (guanine527-N7)-methyltransferase